MAVFAFGEWIHKSINVPGGLPHLGGKDHRGIKPYDIVALAHNRLPPLAANILLEFNTQGAVVPRRASSAVDLRGGEYKPTSLGKVDNCFYAIHALSLFNDKLLTELLLPRGEQRSGRIHINDIEILKVPGQCLGAQRGIHTHNGLIEELQ